MGRRTIDEEQGRQGQLWWMFGVAVLLALTAYYQGPLPVQARSIRGPAQLSAPPASLPISAPQTK